MSELTLKLILAGGRKGFTGPLGKIRVNNGVIILRGDDKTVLGTAKYLGRVYAAFPEGSKELETYGHSPVQASDGGTSPVHGGVQPQQPGTSASSADAGGGGTHPTAGSGSDVPPTGAGHDDSRLGRIAEAVKALDPTNDDHWTGGGLPRVDVVSTAVADPTISRRDVEQAAPGFVRPKP
jgi:hypothetical protein